MRRVAFLLLSTLLVFSHPSGAQSPGIVLGYRDTTCAACRDFFQYANGTWVDTVKMPAEYGRYGTFTELQERNWATLHRLLDSLRAAQTRPGTEDWKVAHFYASCMDSAGAESEGTTPLKPELDRIEALTSVDGVRQEIAHLHRMGVGAVFGFGSGQDAKHSNDVIGIATQGGLGLPDRDFYFRPDTASVALRAAYVEHVATALQMSGLSHEDASQAAQQIMAIETRLATSSMTIVQRRDPNATYHPMTEAALAQMTPALDWKDYLQAVGEPRVATINVAQPDFFKAINTLMDSISVPEWKRYLRWHYVAAMAPWLDTGFVNEDFRFTSRLSGATAIRPRWKRCLMQTDRGLGEALGRVYVQVAFPPEAKAKALAMVKNLETTLAEEIRTLPWMSEATKQQALLKLAAIRNKIGYPDRWRDYSKLVVRDGPFVDNLVAAREFESARELAKIGRPVDRNEWDMTPATVNAYYQSSTNEIAFPAGILQPPFFDPKADDASNYGAIGAVIGHEMTHGFDDHGRQFDAQGNLRDWWTPEDATRYTERADRVVKQFDEFVVTDTVHINGKQTEGENIADLGGLKIAYTAFQKTPEAQAQTPIDGLTPDQRFFIAFAQVWREVDRPTSLRSQVHTDPHSPGRWRVLGPLSNMPEFAKAFHCHAGDPMVRPDSLRAQIW